MVSRPIFHSQLSAIMETMAKSVLTQVCKLVDEDSIVLRVELSRLLVANSTLMNKVNSLESQLTAMRSNPCELCKSHRSVGVQTVRYRDGDACESGFPTIAGIFGKDWCMNLWKDGEPCSLERATDSPQSSGKLMNLSEEMTETGTKEKECVEGTTSSCHQETLTTEKLKASTAEKLEQLPVGYLADSSTSGLPFDQNAEQVVSTGDIEEPSMSINDTEESFNPYVIAIEEEDDDDDLRFVQESQQEPSMSAADGPCHSKRQTKPDTLFENSSALDKYTHGGCSMRAVETAKASKKERFTCRICSRTFFHKGTLTQHMKSHKANFCSICKQHFSHKHSLNSHSCLPPVPSQSDSKSCELCGKKFANPSALRIHNVVHTGEQPYRCSLCGKGFTQKGNLKCHLRIHTGEKPFRCANCGKTFRQKVNLNQHLMAHRNLEVGELKP